MAKKTAAQRLAELELLQAQLKQQQKQEDRRKAYKLGEYVREHMPDLEKSPEFLSWLKTDIDRSLFGAPSSDEPKKAEPQPKATAIQNKPTVAPAATTTKVPESIMNRFKQVDEKNDASPDSIRARLSNLRPTKSA
ncbi:hypothetical protein [Limnobacter sp.]|uniref:hypothetical protein n=1 Tax=Limnobacter sp. TaxID=2003368 RepID=UPI0025B7DEA8|nr:hypothetical protein [Limnobacter sp.]